MKRKIWIDIINPSHPLFFRPLIDEISNLYDINITLRDRGETVKLGKQLGLNGEIIGRDYEQPLQKALSIIIRTLLLLFKIKKFDYAISFENPMSVIISKIMGKKSILLLDNDLKLKVRGNFFQKLETRIKLKANCIIVPDACKKTFNNFSVKNNMLFFNGYKEDFYIADYKPNSRILKELPFAEYIIIRGEALASFYVKEKCSIVPELFSKFKDENINVVFLPRDSTDFRYTDSKNILILKEPLNGLDLIYHSRAVLTGSGTMGREAACLGKIAVSFFPSDNLLSVDRQLINEGKLFYSRNPEEIVNHVVSNYNRKKTISINRSKIVKNEVIKMIKKNIDENI